jgi:hypothetical protein
VAFGTRGYLAVAISRFILWFASFAYVVICKLSRLPACRGFIPGRSEAARQVKGITSIFDETWSTHYFFECSL